MSRIKYTKELLESVVPNCVAVSEVIRSLGLKVSGGMHSHISKKLKLFEIDTSHFLGQGCSRGDRHSGGYDKLPWQVVLVKRSHGYRQKSYLLRRSLIESGRPYICEACKIGDLWNSKELRLQVDHKNGDWLDDSLENVRFLCPNCHSQTAGHNGSKGLSRLMSSSRKLRHGTPTASGLP